ncbi:anaerobic ribonucleoside-triphosphate reductase activating protein [Romboutsia sp. Marseille-P6047]|uniref:anaerobic ribonucleoside-triphosphate reductase activating protein n=1 Tax=Romboutsia sp. Marseille-P6047 TaxID=2161817 RepID=UPI000F04DBDF|nr:anaerobic ribonucleoside-triphosphate reductase activating protein [Romboutsia sp. Marseille-P6047]
MKLRVAAPTMFDSIVDGPGLRVVIWSQGCIHDCIGCHNSQTHNIKGGYEIDTGDIIYEIKNLNLQRGITLSGGEPFLQPEPLAIIAKEAKVNNLDVWAYTGFTFEELLDKSNNMYRERRTLLKEIDVLVDGKFEIDKKDISLRFRGSYNQRIIDVQESLKLNDIILKNEYMFGEMPVVK